MASDVPVTRPPRPRRTEIILLSAILVVVVYIAIIETFDFELENSKIQNAAAPLK